jgi:LssY C-terminus
MLCPHRRSLTACIFLSLFLLPSSLWGQEVHDEAGRLVIPDGTAVRLQMVRTISSAHAREHDRLDFVVVKDVRVRGFVIIPAGTIASGSVVGVKRRRLFGIGGKITIKLDSVKLITGEEVALQASREIKGGSRTKLIMAEMIIAGLVYLPAAPVFLLARGHDSTVLAGTEVTAHIDGDSVVQMAKLLGAPAGVPELGEMMNFLPPHALDGQGHEGDMLNLIFVAKREDLEGALERAGWLKTDKSKPTIFWHLLEQRKHYTKLPMDKLFVFGRAQDYSYALPDPTSIVARRHHLRIWRTDYEMDGSPIWVGAATHDIAIQIQMNKLRIVHRIDPEVDAERDFIAADLANTRLVAHEEYLHCLDPVFKGQTATGDTYYSDSRLVLMELHPDKPGNRDLAREASTSAGGTGGMALVNASR